MKKKFFTVLALIAINGVSIANNHPEAKKVLNEEENIIYFFTDCEDWAMDQMAIRDPKDQMPPEDAYNDYRSLVELCDSH